MKKFIASLVVGFVLNKGVELYREYRQAKLEKRNVVWMEFLRTPSIDGKKKSKRITPKNVQRKDSRHAR